MGHIDLDMGNLGDLVKNGSSYKAGLKQNKKYFRKI